MVLARFTLFGRVSIIVEGQVKRLAPGTAVVLARLVLAGGHLVTVVELSRAIRPDESCPVHREQRVAVQKRISELRGLLDPQHPGESSKVLCTDRGSTTAYRLVADREQVDIFRFEDLVGRARSAPPDLAIALLRRAQELWRDRPLMDVEDRPFAAEAIAHLSRLREDADRLLALRRVDHDKPGRDAEVEALGALAEQVEAARCVGDRNGEAWLLGIMASAYVRLDRHDEALDCYRKTLFIRREIGDRRGESAALSNLATTYAELCRFDNALGCYRKTLTIAREADDWYAQAMALNNLGETYRQMQRLNDAILSYQQSAALFGKIDHRRNEGIALTNRDDARRMLTAMGGTDPASAASPSAE